MKPYEGMAAYKAGKREGRVEMISEFCEQIGPSILNMLALISETTEEDSTRELANDCYNYVNSLAYNEMDIVFKDETLEARKNEIELPEVNKC